MQLDLALAGKGKIPSERRGSAEATATVEPPSARETEHRLRALESQYRRALSRAVAAKAAYLALRGDPAATPDAVRRAYQRWQLLKLQRKGFAARMALIERREVAGAPSTASS